MPEWPTPEEIEQMDALKWAVVRTGMYFIVLSVLMYSLFLWVTVRILENVEILNGSLTWPQSSFITFLFVLARLWNKTFFK